MKSVGFVLMAAVIVVGCAVSAKAQWPLGKDTTQLPLKKEEPVYVTATGRFQIFVSPNHKGHTFMLDTDTGKIWLMKKDGSSGTFSLERVPVEEVDKDGKPQKDKSRDGAETK